PPHDRPHPIDILVGRRMAERRLVAGMNQSDLGRAIGVTFQQVQKYERGANRVSASKLWQAAQALAVPITYFFDGAEAAGDVQTPPVTRQSSELQHLFADLAPNAQRLVLELAHQLSGEK
ncbi:MAG: helix-turn-helix domain-containing protein, partial [Brevundimonas sp.]